MIGPWIHIVPKGELPNKAAGVVQVLDDKALQAIYGNLEADRKSQGDRWPGLYAGREHHIYDDKSDSAALAWFKQFEIRPDGLYAHSDGLTESGRQELLQGKYKFTSFVTDPAKPGSIENLGGNRLRILKIDTVGFTNLPTGLQLLNPIWNRVSQAPAASAALRAGQELLRLANCLVSEHGLSFEQAWGRVRHDHPQHVLAFEGKSNPTTGRAMTFAVHPLHASNALLRLANRRRAECGDTFDCAWQQVQLDNPRLTRAMQQSEPGHELLLNRRPQFPDRETENLWSLAESVEEAVKARLQIPVKLYRDGDSGLNDFQSELQALQAGSGYSFEEAWMQLKATNPQLFFDAMLETPEVQQMTGGRNFGRPAALNFLSK